MTNILLPFSLILIGSHCQDYEDAQEDHERSVTNRTGGNLKKYVPALQKNDQRTD